MYDGRFGSAERTRSAALEGSAKRPFEALFADSKGVHSGLDGLNKPAIESHHTFYRTTLESLREAGYGNRGGRSHMETGKGSYF